ncbi:MAG: hypothetical protein GY898_21160 [Proteobacteria bacterium]|nr:hypothetical protein [Pseudomonadota bacterium]
MKERLERWLPVAAVAGLWIGYGVLREGALADYGYRASMCLVGTILVLARAYAPKDNPTARVVMTLVLIGWCGAVVGSMTGRDLDRMLRRGELRLWSQYHYYLGAKYFPELGYSGLYDQTLAADREGERTLKDLPDVRNLTTYERVPTAYEWRRRNEAWTDARWHAFVADVDWFLPRFKWESWKRILRDRGYNATPAGGALYRLSAALSLSKTSLMFLGLLDPLLLLLAFIAVGRTFGGVKAALAAAWFLLFFGNEFHVLGGPILHDWVAALLLMACAVHTNRPMAAGLLLGYAAMVRVFPGFLLAGLVVWTILAIRRDGTFPRFTNRFGRGVLAAVAIMFVLGCFTGRGLGAWTEWADNIGLHSEQHRFGDKRIGLQHPFTHDWAYGLEDFPNKARRREVWPGQKAAWAGSAGLLLLLWGAAAWRGGRDERDPLDSMVYALPVLFAGIVLSRYYWTIACLFFLLGGRERDGPREAWLGAGLLAWCAAQYVFQEETGDDFGWYVVANLLLAGFFVALLLTRAIRRPPATP